MKKTCNVIFNFCPQHVRDNIIQLCGNLNTSGLFTKKIIFEQNNHNQENGSLFFVNFSKNNEYMLRDFINKTDIKKNQIVIIAYKSENYFDFAIEYGISNFICIEMLNEIILLGLLNRFFNETLGLDSFFNKENNVFDKKYVFSGKVNMQNLIGNTFTDFIDKIQDDIRNSFKMNCHEMITNAFAYGVLGISSNLRDENASEIGNYINIPKEKEIKVHLAMNDEIYGISVMDLRGSLTVNRIMERIRRQVILDGETIPRGIEDYTGRGLTILSHHGLLSFSIKPDVFTIVSLISPIKVVSGKEPISMLTTEF